MDVSDPFHQASGELCHRFVASIEYGEHLFTLVPRGDPVSTLTHAWCVVGVLAQWHHRISTSAGSAAFDESWSQETFGLCCC